MIKGIGNNTRVEDRHGETAVVLHGTPVVKFKRVNSQFNNALGCSVLIEGRGRGFDMWTITLNSGGYRTATTKRRMNEVSKEDDLGFKVYQKNGDWYVDITQKPRGKWQSDTLDFIDGITMNVAVR